MNLDHHNLFFRNQSESDLYGLTVLGGREQQEVLNITPSHYQNGSRVRVAWLHNIVAILGSPGFPPLWNRCRHHAISNLRQLWLEMDRSDTSEFEFDCILQSYRFNSNTHTEVIRRIGQTPSNLAIVDEYNHPLYTRSVGLQLVHEILDEQTGSSGRGVDVFAVLPDIVTMGWYHSHFLELKNRGFEGQECPVNINAITGSDVIPVLVTKRGYGLRRVVLVDLLDVPFKQLEFEAAKAIHHTQGSIVTIVLSPIPLTSVEFNYHPFGL